MIGILFYRTLHDDGHVTLQYNFYDNGFAPSNLVVRKVLMAMLSVCEQELTQFEVEYNDRQLLDKWGGRAGEVLKRLGATPESLREEKSGDIVVSRSFRAQLTAERFQFFHELKDVSLLPHYRFYAGEAERIVYYFNQFLSIRLPAAKEESFWQMLQDMHVPFRVE
ncbi:hypothetical protein ACTID9_20035 [Brevibacillus fluminis]|uniref:hypothetical protein n=1 Tax=Brevibacillus fluminis TaxID=511487 RepID=UPI003F8A3301